MRADLGRELPECPRKGLEPRTRGLSGRDAGRLRAD